MTKQELFKWTGVVQSCTITVIFFNDIDNAIVLVRIDITRDHLQIDVFQLYFG